MREIKFRVWYEDSSEMVDWHSIPVTAGVMYLSEEFDWKNVVFMQYTGLKDKDNVLIYEGDIIKWNNPNVDLQVVEWSEFFYVENLVRDDFHPAVGYKIGHTLYCEVIGNIYENPGLLNSKEASTKGGENL